MLARIVCGGKHQPMLPHPVTIQARSARSAWVRTATLSDRIDIRAATAGGIGACADWWVRAQRGEVVVDDLQGAFGWSVAGGLDHTEARWSGRASSKRSPSLVCTGWSTARVTIVRLLAMAHPERMRHDNDAAANKHAASSAPVPVAGPDQEMSAGLPPLLQQLRSNRNGRDDDPGRLAPRP